MQNNMEKRKDYKLKFRIPNYILQCFLCLVLLTGQVLCTIHVENFKISETDDLTSAFEQFSGGRFRREATSSSSSDPKCAKQDTDFLSEVYNSETNVNGIRLESKHSFEADSNLNLALAWAGKNDDGVLLVVTAGQDSETHTSTSNLWRSDNFGRNWTNLNDKIEGTAVRLGDGVQRNPHNPKVVYLHTQNPYIFVTEDGGLTWQKREVTQPGELPQHFIFHSSPKYENYVMTISNAQKLYVTNDNWKTREQEGSNIVSALWGTEDSGNPETVYCMMDTDESPMKSLQSYISKILSGQLQSEHKLCKFDVGKKNMKTLLEKVASFGVGGKFLYASVFKQAEAGQNAPKIMKISTDTGSSWTEAQLPTLTGERFYSVLDMSEGLIFMHVDNPGDTGHGTLYTSSSKGVIYSVSLERHLYPNFGNSITDFYKVDSMRGVYLASQIDSDSSIHSMITFNRGVDWQHVKAPANVQCPKKVSGCSLQIHNMYSVHRGIKAKLPLSVPDAKGMILVHGHVADSLQTTEPDVFLTTDGGYNWRKILDGPHHYQILDSGGILVAISLFNSSAKSLKFSTDEGHCWHEYTFNDEEINLTGLLTEPGGKSSTIMIWGYHKETRKWRVNVIDFANVIKKTCTTNDYEDWHPHETLRREENKNVEGCLLGKKETFRKLKPDSWCRNTYFYQPSSVSKHCICTREDYECDYGFERQPGTDLCEKTKVFTNDLYICLNGNEEELISDGYRKVPGDVCVDGFKPNAKAINLKKDCVEGSKALVNEAEVKPTETPAPANTTSHLLLTVVIAIVLIVVVTVASFFLYKLYLLRKHKVVYRYSLLNQNLAENQELDRNIEGVLTQNSSLYNDSSDEEQDTARSNGNPFEVPKRKPLNGTMPVKSYHDDSDDDLLN